MADLHLETDTIAWGGQCAKIVDKGGQLVYCIANKAQARFDKAIEEQVEAGRPARVIILKARKLGFSTWTQVKILHRLVQLPHRRAMVVAHDMKTASELFGIGHRIYNYMDPAVFPKPPLQHFKKGRLLHLGEPSPKKRAEGMVGIDSAFEVDTANEVEAGRGYTIHDLHGSEVAFWPDSAKLLSLLNAVPDEPGTMIVLESTANGTNFFKVLWDRAVKGESEYVPLFFAWFEDPSNVLYMTPEQIDSFEVGVGPWGEDEQALIDDYGVAIPQLAWRRFAIVDKCDSNLEKFHQEYPAPPPPPLCPHPGRWRQTRRTRSSESR